MESNNPKLDLFYKYRTISVDHLKKLQEDIDKLRNNGKLSDNKVYRSYIDTKKFEIPENFEFACFSNRYGINKLLDMHYHSKDGSSKYIVNTVEKGV